MNKEEMLRNMLQLACDEMLVSGLDHITSTLGI